MDWEICHTLIEMTIISGNIQNSNISEKLLLLYKPFKNPFAFQGLSRVDGDLQEIAFHHGPFHHFVDSLSRL